MDELQEILMLVLLATGGLLVALGLTAGVVELVIEVWTNPNLNIEVKLIATGVTSGLLALLWAFLLHVANVGIF